MSAPNAARRNTRPASQAAPTCHVHHTVQDGLWLAMHTTEHIDDRGSVNPRWLQSQRPEGSVAARHRVPGVTVSTLHNVSQ